MAHHNRRKHNRTLRGQDPVAFACGHSAVRRSKHDSYDPPWPSPNNIMFYIFTAGGASPWPPARFYRRFAIAVVDQPATKHIGKPDPTRRRHFMPKVAVTFACGLYDRGALYRCIPPCPAWPYSSALPRSAGAADTASNHFVASSRVANRVAIFST